MARAEVVPMPRANPFAWRGEEPEEERGSFSIGAGDLTVEALLARGVALVKERIDMGGEQALDLLYQAGVLVVDPRAPR